MGLDVSAMRGLQKLDAVFDAYQTPIDPVTREEFECETFQACVHPDFPDQAAGLEDRGVYTYAEEKRFWSGGYGRYNAWREQLAKLAGYEAVPYERVQGYAPSMVMSHQVGAFQYDSGPFLELVCFADCEGTIGTAVAAKLAKDFADHDEAAKATGDEWFYAKYVEWQQCFEFASDNGAVDFH